MTTVRADGVSRRWRAPKQPRSHRRLADAAGLGHAAATPLRGVPRGALRPGDVGRAKISVSAVRAKETGEDGVAAVECEIGMAQLDGVLAVIGAVADVADQDILVTAAERYSVLRRFAPRFLAASGSASASRRHSAGSRPAVDCGKPATAARPASAGLAAPSPTTTTKPSEQFPICTGIQRAAVRSSVRPPIQAVVKWYNLDKGFGFVQLADGSGDAFLRVSVVERSGHYSVRPGATLEVRAGPGAKGPQVTEILSVDSSTEPQEMPRRGWPERPIYPSANQAVVEEIGTVKWYNTVKGFGFIGSDRGGKDIFVHATVLNRAGIADFAEGQRVVVDGRKGPEAASLRLI